MFTGIEVGLVVNGGQEGGGSRHYLPPLLIVLFGLCAGMVAFYAVRVWENEKIKADFKRVASNRTSAIEHSIETKKLALESIKAFYLSSEEVTPQKFRTFVRTYFHQLGGIQALQWLKYVKAEDRERYERSVRARGFQDFQITDRAAQGEMIKAAQRDEYFPVDIVEPLAGNESSLGFDPSSNPKRLQALLKSRDTGEVVATGRIILVQEDANEDLKRKYGIVIFVPVYEEDGFLDTDESRQKYFKGFVAGVFHVEDIMEKALVYLQPEGSDILICDESASRDEQFLYYHASRIAPKPSQQITDCETFASHPLLFTSKLEDVGGREWSIKAVPTAQYIEAGRTIYPWCALFSVLIVTFLLAGYFIVSIGQTLRIKKLVQDRTHALEESQKKYKTLLESLPQRIFYKDNNSVFVSCNDNFAKDLELKPRDIIGKTDYDFYPADLADKYVADDRKVIESGEDLDIEEKHIIDEKLIFVHTSKKPFRDSKGNIIGILGLFWDVTEQKRAQEELKISEERFGLALEATKAGFWDWNIVTDKVYYSPRFAEFLGEGMREGKGLFSDVLKIVHPDDRNTLVEKINECRDRNKEEFETEFRLGKPIEGEWKWISVQGKVFDRDKVGKPVRIVGTHIDISERKKEEEEKEKLITELEAKNAELERFTYSVSHDLKTPLITIRGFLGLLEVDALEGNKERLKDDVSRIVNATEKMHQLLNELLELSRIGRIINEPEEFAWNDIVTEALDLVEGRISERNVSINVLPDCLKLYGDRQRLRGLTRMKRAGVKKWQVFFC